MHTTTRVRAVIALAAITLTTGCPRTVTGDSATGLSPDDATTTTTTPAPAEPLIVLEQLAPELWRVTYQLTETASKLRFRRAAQWHRESTWTVLTPGYELARDGNSQVLTVTAGASPSATISVEIAGSTEPMQGEYRPVLSFSDGASAFYTGHLYLRDVATESTDGAPYLQAIELRPTTAARVAVRGEVVAGTEAVRWTDAGGEGTYVYFGPSVSDSAPVVSSHMTAILDPGLPPPLRQQIMELLPPMFDTLAEGHGAELPWRPTVMVGWEGGREGERYWEGGVLPGIIYMGLGGNGWRDAESTAHSLDLAQFVGHEASHFWNGWLISNDNPDEAWLHEGSADAIADLLLLRLGLIDSAELVHRQERAVNHCLNELSGAALTGAAKRRGRDVYYPCGSMMATWSDAAVGSADLLQVWASLIERVGPSSDYDVDDYFEALRAVGAQDEIVGAMRAVAGADSDTQREDVIAGFQAVGLELVAVSRPPTDERLGLAARALAHLQSASCGQVSVTRRETHLTAHALPNCPTFPAEADVYTIAGWPVADGDHAYDSVRSACSKGRTVALLGIDGSTVAEVDCRAPLPARWTWLRFRSASADPAQ